MPVYTLFGQPASPASLHIDTGPYTMGVQFSTSQVGTLTAIWFFSAPSAVTLPASIQLFAVSGASLVVSQAAAWSGAAASGWVRAPLTTPPSLTAGVSYKGCVFHIDASNWYSSTGAYWSSGPGSGGITSGPLTAPNSAGGDHGQDTYDSSGVIAYPTTMFNAANYWVDVEVTTVAAAVPSWPGGGRSLLKTSMLWADL